MVMEIDKMVMLYEKVATDAERNEINKIIETISDVFEKMLEDFKKYVITGEREEIDFTESIECIKKLREIGEKYGEEFPLITDESGARVYIAQFGSQIVKMG